jgi:hypothetical protein
MSDIGVKIGLEIVLSNFDQSGWLTVVESMAMLNMSSETAFYNVANRYSVVRTRQKRKMYYSKSQIVALATEWEERRKIRVC